MYKANICVAPTILQLLRFKILNMIRKKCVAFFITYSILNIFKLICLTISQTVYY